MATPWNVAETDQAMDLQELGQRLNPYPGPEAARSDLQKTRFVNYH